MAHRVDVSHLNNGKISHLNDHNSFKSTFLSEVQGILHYYLPTLASLLHHISRKYSGNSVGNASDYDTDALELASRIHCAFEHNPDKVTTMLPTLWVNATLHAAIRWDKTRKYKPGDIYDFHHAVAAIPYCDYFLTEHSLCHLIKQPNLRLSQVFKCQAFSIASEALNAIS